jgi:hypothetical protein
LLHDDAFLAAVDRAGVAVLLLHALNPYGFSHLRRVNEDNADLNRNFMDFRKPLPVNAAYAEIHSLLLPGAWPPPVRSEAKLDAWIAKHGPQAYQAAVSGGQYHFPKGMFYGGAGPAWSNRVLRAVLRERGATAARLCWIDFHTGLGPSGHGEKIYAGLNNAADIARTKVCWDDDVTSFLDGSSTSAPLTGVNGAAPHDECPAVQFAGIALEYGTYPIDQVLQSLRSEHWLHNHPEAPAAQRKEIKRLFRDMFYVDADDWKTMVYAQAVQAALKEAIGHLTRASRSLMQIKRCRCQPLLENNDATLQTKSCHAHCPGRSALAPAARGPRRSVRRPGPFVIDGSAFAQRVAAAQPLC